jgi:5'(3')-deoxyribonucleotidase
MKYKNIYLDFDATLADFGNYWVEYLNSVIPDFNIKLYDIETYNQYIHEDAQLVRAFWHNEEHYCKMQLFDGAFEFVQDLLSIGYDVRIVTSTPREALSFKHNLIKELLYIKDERIIHVENACLKFQETKNGILVDDFILPILNHVFSNNCPGIVYNHNGMHPWADVNLNNDRYAESVYKIRSENLYYMDRYDQIRNFIASINGEK